MAIVDRAPLMVETASGPVVVAKRYQSDLLRLDARTGAREVVSTECPAGAPYLPFDATGDGFAELLATTSDGAVCILSVPGLQPLWRSQVREVYGGVPAIGNIDGDAGLELVALSPEGYVDAFDLSPSSPGGPNGSFPILVGTAFAGAVGLLAALARWRRRRSVRSSSRGPAPIGREDGKRE